MHAREIKFKILVADFCEETVENAVNEWLAEVGNIDILETLAVHHSVWVKTGAQKGYWDKRPAIHIWYRENNL